MALALASRYWHTLRHLRPVQLYARLWFRVARPVPVLTAAPPVRPATGGWVPCARSPSLLGPERVRFLGVEGELASARDWNAPERPKLWLYNAHYFDDLVADGAAARATWHRNLLARWVAENPPGRGNGWESYPCSLRIVNWIKWALSGNALAGDAVHSLAVQARHLRRRLEVHLLGNHLWANAKALVFAGSFFSGPEAERWRAKGLALLRRELDEQILADGGHFERSPMYHAIVLEDLLDLVQLAGRYPGLFGAALIAHWSDTAGRMLHWSRVLAHPDGGIGFFNDAALGIAPPVAALEDYAGAVGLAVDGTPLADIEALPASGYVRLAQGPAVLLADVGEIGPDYLPGHAHADTLSFELSLWGERLLVNGGTSTYAAGAARLQQRGTAMHNTLQIDDADSSEVWGSFRVARRARPFDVAWGRDGGQLHLEGAHDGYRRLPGRPVHRRRLELEAGGLYVTDTIEGRCARACARYRFRPGTAVRTTSAAGGEVRLPGGRVLAWSTEGGRARVVPSTWHPCFGASESCECLELEFTGPQAGFRLVWQSKV